MAKMPYEMLTERADRARDGTAVPICHLCGTVMQRKTLSTGNAVGIARALIVFAVGVAISVTGVGALIGIPICICSLFMGGRREKVLVCPNCRAKTPAA